MAEVKMFTIGKKSYRAVLKDGEIPSCEIRQLSALPGGGAMMSENPVYIGFGGWEENEDIDSHIAEFKSGYSISAISEQGFKDWDCYNHEQLINNLKAAGKWKPDKVVEAEAEEHIKAELAAQKELCQKENLPFFVPHDGKCFKCGRNVFVSYPDNECVANGDEFITGCPHCGQTFCD